QATMAVQLQKPRSSWSGWAEAAAEAFGREGVIMGEEPADAAYGLARLSIRNERYTKVGLGYLRRAVECIDAAVERMSASERPRYLGRPSISIILNDAQAARVSGAPDPQTYRVRVL
ncbi:MAG: hypothetical protein AAF449_25000, partial [Myxococcota bacterium]